jgi:addiction module HigA family antidote
MPVPLVRAWRSDRNWRPTFSTQSQLAKAIGISPNRIAEIVNNRRRITADTALRLSLYFGNSPEFWMNLQTYYDLKMAQQNLAPEDAKRIKALRAA